MNYRAKLSLPVLFFSAAILSGSLAQAQTEQTSNSKDQILFKIHNIVPEKDMNGKVLYCNFGATFFNRTPNDINNVSLSLIWNDSVIGETIDLEERADKEARRANPNAQTSRYTTASLTSRDIKATIKLPPIKANQQITLKSKVSTDRCFLLLEDMDVSINNCGTIGLADKTNNKDCANLFEYVSPKSAEYYQEFKEISLEDQQNAEDVVFNETNNEIEQAYNTTIENIKNITDTTAVNVPDDEATSDQTDEQ